MRRIGLTVLAALLMLAIVLLITALPARATASGADTCKDAGFDNLTASTSGAWGSVDFDDTKTELTFTVNEGYEVRLCVKAGSSEQGNGPETTEWFGPGEYTLSHSSGKALSHYGVLFQTVTTTTLGTTTTTQAGLSVEVEGYCVVDQNGTGLAYADLSHPGYASFVLNGEPVVGDHFGVNARFGLNTWSATAKPGFTLTGETSGSFFIDECGNPGTTTTTVPGATTTPTTVPDPTTAPDATLTIPPDQGTPVTLTTVQIAETLPFTGINVAVLAGIAAALVGLGVVTLRGRTE